MSRDLTNRFYIRTMQSDTYGFRGIHEIRMEGNEGFILKCEGCSRDYVEPILEAMNKTLISAFQAGYDQALCDNPSKSRRKSTKKLSTVPSEA